MTKLYLIFLIHSRKLQLLIVLLFISVNAFSATYYVNDASTSGDIFCTAIGNNGNNGTSSTTPKLTLKNLWMTYGPSGSNTLTSGDIIKIDAGTYSATGFASVDEAKFDITVTGLTFEGAGTNLTIFDHNFHGGTSDYFMWIKANNTTVKNLSIQEFGGCPSCSGVTVSGVETGGQAFTIDNAINILIENVKTFNNGGNGNSAITVGPNSQVVLRGGGSTCNAMGATYSGGIDVLGSNIDLLIENYVIAFNSKSAFFGSGLYVWGDNTTTKVVVKNTRISDNLGKEGTGLYLDGGDVTIKNSIINGNSSIGGNYGGGAVIYHGIAQFKNSIISNNAGVKGGGIAVYPNNGPVNLILDTVTFTGNSASASRGVDLYFRPRNSTNTFDATINNVGFSTGGNTITFEGTNVCTNSSVSITNSGNPTIQDLATDGTCTIGSVFTVVNNPVYTVPNPSPPQYAGDCASGVTILPVELISFSATCTDSYAQLHWSTATEHNNDYFTIEHASEDGDFKTINTVNGKLNSTIKTDYYLTDYFSQQGLNYYRLSQTDTDGRFKVLSTISMVNDCLENDPQISCFFNSEENMLLIGYSIEKSDLFNIKLYNSMGQLLFESEELFHASDRVMKIKLNEYLTSGVYFVQLSNGAEILSNKVMVNK